MAISPWMAMTFTLRRWTLFATALCCRSSVLISFSPNIEAIYALRLLQGLAGGLIIPLLMTTALRVLTPNIRLYGLGVYALTATFTPALAATVAAFWTDVVDWRALAKRCGINQRSGRGVINHAKAIPTLLSSLAGNEVILPSPGRPLSDESGYRLPTRPVSCRRHRLVSAGALRSGDGSSWPIRWPPFHGELPNAHP
jgi:MFS family permease